MTLEYFLLLLMIVSIFTGLVTEGIKKLLEESKKTYKANFLAGGVAVVLSVQPEVLLPVPVIIFKRVDFPAPLIPTIAAFSWSSILKEQDLIL